LTIAPVPANVAVPMATVLEICKGLALRSFAAGETVMAEGATDGVLYVLVEGAVEIVKGDVQINTVAEPGAIFGEVSVLLGLPHMATVKALQASVFHVAGDASEFLRSNPEVALAVATLLAKRLHIVTTYLIDLKRQFETHEGHLSLVDEVLESLVHHQEPHTEPGSDRHPDPTVE
jgi:CRP-like cAMP-binding protein